MEEVLPQVDQKMDQVQNEVASQLSIGEWIITFLLVSIPLVNLILLFVWAFDANSARRNFSRAYLIIIGVMFVLGILLVIMVFLFGVWAGIFGSLL